ncbi:hypothetical protein [Sebaldella sp. S0638]|uniref:hypothetical protein n=1 Tax=Sebaldella sp. S0638 TaxID=2957809 RepID=UPI00209EC52B|nr:hypothetical protein [Sebaldella sp. S0638]MCP1226179.1 hypothetical protein [Sebaldella sp. S0638]
MKKIEYILNGKAGEISVDEAKTKYENVNFRCAVKLEDKGDTVCVSTKSKTTNYKNVNGNWEAE